MISHSDIIAALQKEFIDLVGDGVTFDKPLIFRASPHDPGLTIKEVKPTDNFTNRQLLAAINQKLRWKQHYQP